MRPEPGSGRGALSPASVMVTTAIGSVVLGGLLAAVTDPLDLAHGSWAAAYLVLVTGVGQAAMGRRRGSLPSDHGLWRSGWWQWATWNGGGAAVILGTMFARWMVDVGTVLVFVALVLAFQASRAEQPARDSTERRSTILYRALLLILTVSAPIGLLLSHLRQP